MLKDVACFLYGFDINQNNRYIPFKNVTGGPELTATLNVGNYTGTQMMAELKRAMEFADGVYKWDWTIDRTISSGTSNQVTVISTAPQPQILFMTGATAPNSPFALLGFTATDLTGSSQYTSPNHCGTILIPEFPTWDYLGPDNMVTNDGSKNVSASGIKETLVFAQMFFAQGQWQYISNFNGRTQLTEWQSFMKYAIKQLQWEFTPSIYEDPEVFYQVTLESTPADSNGMGYKMNQMRGMGLYRFYDTGTLKFRLIPG